MSSWLDPWWAKGVRFECQGSGKCCTSRGQHGFVYLTLEDRRRMAKVLKMTPAAFTRKHCAKTGEFWHLKHPELDCQFLEGKRCTVYSGRPEQCRTWPFWPEHMNPKDWNREVKAFCPGIGKGKLYTRTEIEKRLDWHEKAGF